MFLPASACCELSCFYYLLNLFTCHSAFCLLEQRTVTNRNICKKQTRDSDVPKPSSILQLRLKSCPQTTQTEPMLKGSPTLGTSSTFWEECKHICCFSPVFVNPGHQGTEPCMF
ncbi:hypothetical protein AMECASPLE_018853 [Ameca splendens]|uniref:Secreted protein n=1 Tax=Ameca splendens TaxID=208324 RepID=A0ABV1AAV4_9TELE